jgi:hypothetical protein
MTPPRLPRASLSVVVLALVCAGCGSPATPSAAKQAAEQSAGPTPSPEPEAAVPVIASDEATFDFGTIAPNEKVKHVFKLVNRGRADLHIERVERT